MKLFLIFTLISCCGYYFGANAQTTCIGGYAPSLVANNFVCTPCPAGTASSAGDSVCHLCPQNTYSLAKATSCTNCTEHSFSGIGESKCQCYDGFYVIGQDVSLLCVYYPTAQPTRAPSNQPTGQPSRQPTSQPTRLPTSQPISHPSSKPSGQPSSQPSRQPTTQPTRMPTCQPSSKPTNQPTSQPSSLPTALPTVQPTTSPTYQPSRQPSVQPSSRPSAKPTCQPSSRPSSEPTLANFPTSKPSAQPIVAPTSYPTAQPSVCPSGNPTVTPSSSPTTNCPTSRPSTTAPTSSSPTSMPTTQPSRQPTGCPTAQPSVRPTAVPTTNSPSSIPTGQPTASPTSAPSTSVVVIKGFNSKNKYFSVISTSLVVAGLTILFIGVYAVVYYKRYKSKNLAKVIDEANFDGVDEENDACGGVKYKTLYNHVDHPGQLGIMQFGKEAYEYDSECDSNNDVDVDAEIDDSNQYAIIIHEDDGEQSNVYSCRDNCAEGSAERQLDFEGELVGYENMDTDGSGFEEAHSTNEEIAYTNDAGGNFSDESLIPQLQSGRPNTAPANRPDHLGSSKKLLRPNTAGHERPSMGSEQQLTQSDMRYSHEMNATADHRMVKKRSAKTRKEQLDGLFSKTITKITNMTFHNVSEFLTTSVSRPGSAMPAPQSAAATTTIATLRQETSRPLSSSRPTSASKSKNGVDIFIGPVEEKPKPTVLQIPRDMVSLSSAIIMVKPYMWLNSGIQYIITSALAKHKITIKNRITYTPSQLQEQNIFNKLFIRLVSNSRQSNWLSFAATESEKSIFQSFSHNNESWEDAVGRRAFITPVEAMELLDMRDSRAFYQHLLQNESCRICKSFEVTKMLVPFVMPPQATTVEANISNAADNSGGKKKIWESENAWEDIHMLTESVDDMPSKQRDSKLLGSNATDGQATIAASCEADGVQPEPVQQRTPPMLTRWVYVVNGFVPAMRDAFHENGAAVTVLKIEWNAVNLPWTSLMDSVIGNREPSKANPDSIRGAAYIDWQSLELPNCPTLLDNIVHCSSSAIEAMLDRVAWNKDQVLLFDPFYLLVSATIDRPFLVQLWLNNCIVEVEYNEEEFQCERNGIRYVPERGRVSLSDSASAFKRSLEWFDRCDPNEVIHISKFFIQKLNEPKLLTARHAKAAKSFTFAVPTGISTAQGSPNRAAPTKELGFLLIKPPFSQSISVHNTVKRVLGAHNIRILRRVDINAEDVTSKTLFELQFASYWSWASELKPAAIKPTKQEERTFERYFGISFDNALAARRLLNANGGRVALGCNNSELSRRWLLGSVMKLRKGIYVSKIEIKEAAESKEVDIGAEETIFVVNGFALAIRDQFICEGSKTSVLSVEWDSSALGWSKFMSQVVGSTDPTQAHPNSIRGRVYAESNIHKLGVPDIANNVVFSSRSALEAMRDRLRWIQGSLAFTDPFGSVLIRERLRLQDIEKWLLNPMVILTPAIKEKVKKFTDVDIQGQAVDMSKATNILSAISGLATSKVTKAQVRDIASKEASLKAVNVMLDEYAASSKEGIPNKIRASRHFVAPEIDSDEEGDNVAKPENSIVKEEILLFELLRNCGVDGCIEILKEIAKI